MIANRHAANAQVRGAECSVFANSGAFPDGYIGDSTRAEIAYARNLGKPIRFTHPPSRQGAVPGGSGWREAGGVSMEPTTEHHPFTPLRGLGIDDQALHYLLMPGTAADPDGGTGRSRHSTSPARVADAELQCNSRRPSCPSRVVPGAAADADSRV